MTDQLSRLAACRTNPMVEVTPERRTATLPRTVMPGAPISADSAWTDRFSSTGWPAAISSPVTAAIRAESGTPCCSRATSLPSASDGAVELDLGALESVQLDPVTSVSSARATTSSLTRTASVIGRRGLLDPVPEVAELLGCRWGAGVRRDWWCTTHRPVPGWRRPMIWSRSGAVVLSTANLPGRSVLGDEGLVTALGGDERLVSS